MLDHLLPNPPEPRTDAASSFVPIDTASPRQAAKAKLDTDAWLRAMGVEDEPSVDPAYENALAAHAFATLTGGVPATEADQKKAVMGIHTHAGMAKMGEMLSAYEQSFVDKADSIRNYIVNKLLDEAETTRNPNIKLKALKMLGDVTEVGLFTHRVENVTRDLSDEQINAEIQKRLDKITFNPDTPLLERVDDEE